MCVCTRTYQNIIKQEEMPLLWSLTAYFRHHPFPDETSPRDKQVLRMRNNMKVYIEHIQFTLVQERVLGNTTYTQGHRGIMQFTKSLSRYWRTLDCFKRLKLTSPFGNMACISLIRVMLNSEAAMSSDLAVILEGSRLTPSENTLTRSSRVIQVTRPLAVVR